MPSSIRRCLRLVLLLSGVLATPLLAQDDEELPPVSEATESCLFCHENLHPGIVGDWLRSRHARTTMAEALAKDPLERRVSADSVPEEFLEVSVGCAECHSLNPDSHPDTVEHGDDQMHTVVSPPDCALCHPVEVDEYQHNLMSQAHDNLVKNPLYRDLMDQINGVQEWDGEELSILPPHFSQDEDSCLACHGTKVEVLRVESRSTPLGVMDFAVLSGWPNQGVGRINPDGSRGACTACHARHQFSLEMARKPHTCAQCHKGPDTPANAVYEVSKHGNIFKSHGDEWDWDAMPWVVGEDFTAPTCATCHMSGLVNPMGVELVKQTHRMNDRLYMRLFGLPYAHPHVKEAVTHTIRNSAGLSLPTELTGEPVASAVIDAEEMARRKANMQKVCRSCHSNAVVDGHFARLDSTVEATNAMTLAATKLLMTGWETGAAKGPDQGDSIFNDTLEKMWVEQWLFHANSTRLAAAMMGQDYGVFANGRWQAAKNLRAMATLLKTLEEKDGDGDEDGE